MNSLVLGLGSNLGDRIANLQEACLRIEQEIGPITSYSSVYDSPPLGFEATSTFLNMCITCATPFFPQTVLTKIQSIENDLGRIRSETGYISRTLDIDIIFFNHLVLTEGPALIPHPAFRERKFVLLPLNDLDASFMDPVTHLTMKELLYTCSDDSLISCSKKNLFSSE
ncbi:MAG: 2-amino-4-hydroxy-6-hydroxymethyldihydropteridine diphosphokinase [Bacteroidetes bacterium RIFCSPHIGHO2_02_FULL_44_7]|nr:MAG: 2-amino-4-hydroxy-6-hydroxymethyldihydropteridine diphosphokinase [Bacteroidetes bacterium RIFCSPHIGHO2_02_FULL_44_7]